MMQTPLLELVRPAAVSVQAPELSADQAAVVGLASGTGPVLIWGAPGTGKSTVLVEAAVKRIEADGVDPAGVLLLGPSRLAASGLRDRLSARLDRSLSTSPARTWASYAFDVLRRAKVEGRLPHLERAPKLLSGPEQDLIIKELLDGHRLGIGRAPAWPEDLREALGTRGFRQEIRQLFDRVIEYGLAPEELAALGVSNGRQDWIAAADLYGEYRDVVDWGKSGSFDPAGIITAVIGLFESDTEYLDRERDRLQLILVDDIQEANQAVHRLLELLGRGKDVLITGCPDTVVQGFRGARPDLAGKIRERLAGSGGVTEAVLSTSHRLNPELARAWGAVAERISLSRGGHKARILQGKPGPGRCPAADADTDTGPDAGPYARTHAGVREPTESAAALTAHLVASEIHELRLVAERILDLQHYGKRRLADIAVIVRTGSQLAQLQRYLSGQGISVKVPVAENAVRDEAAVQPLLDAFRVVLDPERLDAELAVSLLTSRLGRSTAISLRRLRQALRREELIGGSGRASDSLLIEALLHPAALSQLGWEGKNAARMGRMLAAGQKALEDPGANAETVLWALWEESGCSDYWAAQALAGGPAGIRADRDLDAIMALFQTAERYVDQLPGSSPRQFLEYLLNQELPMDTLAARAQRSDAVEILTPASAAGREWPVVIVAGLQEGIWPNTRLRGELLGSQLLVDVLERGAAAAHQLGPAARLREIRYDELRSFSTAISRASERLICTAASSADLQPSQFLDIVAPWEPRPGSSMQTRPVEQVSRPMTLRSLVAELRQESETAADPEAARVLAVLTEARAPGASPETWWGLAPLTSEAAIVPGDEPVNVSPSRMEAVLKSPLNWFIQAAGGEAATDFARSLGTLVHSIAQEHPDAGGHQYIAELQRRWPTLGMKDTWEGKLDLKRAEEMVRKLALYVIQMRSEGRSLLAVEQDFSVDIPADDIFTEAPPAGDPPAVSTAATDPGAADDVRQRMVRLRGQVDRLEIDGEGNLVIIDLKTGRRKPKAAELADHPQLGAYQAAVAAGAFTGLDGVPAGAGTGGARLAQLGDGTRSLNVQEQESLEAKADWATPLVRRAAGLMSGSTFMAIHDPKGGSFNGSCPVPEVCPLCSAGKQITE
ncbi:ATP-dependent helicase [Arthrobacter sp. A5]|uniref:ATP-dependent helicase n=1 Tax=Arthrobacter sp. A5 TaxID=576926 RepID=UPI003DA9A19F